MKNSVSLRLAAVRWNGPSGRNSSLGQTQFVRFEREERILPFTADRWDDSFRTNATAASTHSCKARSEAAPSLSTKIIDFIALPVKSIGPCMRLSECADALFRPETHNKIVPRHATTHVAVDHESDAAKHSVLR
jgi:hypothetical protein